MSVLRRRWWVGPARPPQVRFVDDGHGKGRIVIEPPDEPEENDGDRAALIFDEQSGVSYRVTVERIGEGDPYLTSLRVIPPEGQRVTVAMLREVDPAALAAAAQQYRDNAAGAPNEYVVVQPTGLRPARGELPHLPTLAGKVTGGATLAMLQEEYGVSRATVARWIKAAREAGHLAPIGAKKASEGRRTQRKGKK